MRLKQLPVNGILVFFICAVSFSSPPSAPKPPVLLRYTHPAKAQEAGGFLLNASLYYASDISFANGAMNEPYIKSLSDNRPPASKNAQLLTGDFNLSLGITRSFFLAVSLPVYGDFAGWGDTRGMVGDLAVAGTFIPSLFSRSDLFSAGGRLGIIAPTGNIEESIFPRHAYYIRGNEKISGASTYTYNKTFIYPSLVMTLDFQNMSRLFPLQLHFNLGTVVSDWKECVTANGALAVTFQPVNILQFAVEFTSETRLFKPGRTMTNGFLADPLRCVPSGTVNLPGGFSVMVAGDIGLSSNKETLRSNWYRSGYAYSTKTVPSYGAAITLVYSGNFRKVAAALQGAGFKEGDRDNDSIPDSLDTCRETPEDRDGFEDDDGCPEYDNDNDGIVDEVDGCPDNPEDNDNFEDKDGCPDYDNDNDQIPDTSDACPDKKGRENNRGCPEEGPFSFNRTVLDGIAFKTGTSKIISGRTSLDRITEAMKELPRSKIEIQVHTDNRLPVRKSADLSQRRADALKLYLVSKGIRTDRIKALGLGSEFPIADNTTREGRAKNSRVEVRRTD